MKAISKLRSEAGYINIILGFLQIFIWVSGAKKDMMRQWVKQGSSRHLSRKGPCPLDKFYMQNQLQIKHLKCTEVKILNQQSKNKGIFKKWHCFQEQQYDVWKEHWPKNPSQFYSWPVLCLPQLCTADDQHMMLPPEPKWSCQDQNKEKPTFLQNPGKGAIQMTKTLRDNCIHILFVV